VPAGALLAFGVAAALLGCGTPEGPARAYRRSVAMIESAVDSGARAFEEAAERSDPDGMRAAAQKTASTAVRARDALERLPIAPALEPARGEELIYLNHVHLGFAAFAESPGTAADLTRLREVLRRGRAHREIGRKAAL
jgi:hypothetical protein